MAYRETPKMRARKARKREQILVATGELVAAGGFQAAHISAVARQAGVATGTVYRHFPSKAQLFTEYFRRATAIEVTAVAAALEQPGSAAARLRHALQLFARRALKNPTAAWALIAEPLEPAVDQERLYFRAEYAGLFERVIRAGVDARELPPQEPGLSSTALVGAIAEALVGPLAPARQQQQPLTPLMKTELQQHIIRFCLQAITGEEEAHHEHTTLSEG